MMLLDESKFVENMQETQVKPKRIMIVGNPLPFHVGHHFFGAAQKLGFKVSICDTRGAGSTIRLLQTVYWRLGGRRPVHLASFGRNVVKQCQQHRPDILLAIGIAPLDTSTLQALNELGIQCANFLTDDPWNRVHSAQWFLKALPLYHNIFTPRHANIMQLRAIGCQSVEYLPFAYNPDVHYLEQPPSEAATKLHPDIVFAGGADPDRLPWITALIDAGFKVALYGHYWERDARTRPYARGQADLSTLRQVIAASHVNLCLVRQANRDDHVMRTFEIPAMGGCMLTEYTTEHQRILGSEGDAVVYFHTIAEMVEKTKWLLENTAERRRLSNTAYGRITQNKHTYQDRLMTILQSTEI